MSKESQIKQEKNDIDIGTLFKFVKPFDGTREKLNSFLTNCNNAIELASSNQKSILLKYILSQLEGKAESACSIKEFESWEQLSSFLTTQFGERKHYTHLLTDLQESKQSNQEPVSQFALRIETYLSKLLTEVTLSNKKKSELIGRTAAMEDLALHTFLIGLKPEISNIVRGNDPVNLNEAINLAVAEEKIQNIFNKRNYTITPQRPVQKLYSYKPTNPNNNFRQPTNRQNDRNSPTLFCRYCKTPGHTIEVCRKREYNNNRFRVPQISQFSHNKQEHKNSRVNCIVNNSDQYDSEAQPSTSTTDNEYEYNDNNLNE